MQYEQKLLQPYMMLTKPKYGFERFSGSPSQMVPPVSSTSNTCTRSLSTFSRYSGNRYALCVPNTRSIKGYWRISDSAMPSSCVMQPPTQMISSGLSFFSSFSQITLPSALFSAFSRTQQVLYRIRSASSRVAASVKPISVSMPANVSLSRTFIWQPSVTM